MNREILCIAASLALLTGCADPGAQPPTGTRQGHVLEDTTATIDRAREVEGVIADRARARPGT